MKFNLAQVAYTKLPFDMKTPADLSKWLIGEAVNRRWPQGMPRLESRIYARVQDQFFGDGEEVEFSDEAFILIKETLDKSELAPHCSSWKWTLLAALEAASKAQEKK